MANATSFLQVIDLGLRALLFEKFKDIMRLQEESRDCVLYPKGVAQRMVAERRGEGSVEFINLWRTSTSFSWARHRTPAARRGMCMEFADPNKKGITTVKAVPMDLEYTVWFWSRNLDLLQQVIESYMFWIHQDPKLYLQLNEKYPLEFYLAFGTVSDESVVAEQYEMGEYFVISAPIKMDAWVFNTVDTKTILYIHVALFDSTVSMQNAIPLRDWWIPKPPPA